MALIGAGLQVIPLMGAAVFLPSAMATALRLPVHAPSASDRRDEYNKESLDALFAILTPEERGAIGFRTQVGENGVLKIFYPRISESDDYPDDDISGDYDDEDEDAVDLKNENVERTLSFDRDRDGSTETPRQRPAGSLDTWSVVWYCGMFAAFTSLFLIMPCSQVLCKAGLAAARRDPRLRPRPPLLTTTSGIHYGTPPPPYKQFAPPPYESLFVPNQSAGPPPPHPEKSGVGVGVYIIPLRDESQLEESPSPSVDTPPPPYSEALGESGNSALVTAAVAAVAAAATAPTHCQTGTGMSPSVA